MEKKNTLVLVTDRKQLPIACYNLVFFGIEFKWLDKIYKVERTQFNKIPFVKVSDWTYIAQNPHKISVWGGMAKEGYKILWIIHETKYIGRVINGEVEKINQ